MREHDTGTLWDGSLPTAPHCQLCPQVSLKERPHVMCFRSRLEAVGVQEHGCSWPLGLGKQMTWKGSLPCGKNSASLSPCPKPPAISVLSWLLSSCRTPDVNECQSEPCKNSGTCQDLPGSFACYCPEGFLGTQCETGRGSPSWVSGRLDCGHQDAARVGTMPSGWSLSWTS